MHSEQSRGEMNLWVQFYWLTWCVIILTFKSFIAVIVLLMSFAILELEFYFLIKQHCPPTILSQNTAYHPLHESITHKDFGKFTQQGISFDEGATYPNYLPLCCLSLLFIF